MTFEQEQQHNKQIAFKDHYPFLTLEKPPKDMIIELVGTDFYHSPGWNKDFPKLQILTVEDLLDGKQVQLPPSLHTFKTAENTETENEEQRSLEL